MSTPTAPTGANPLALEALSATFQALNHGGFLPAADLYCRRVAEVGLALTTASRFGTETPSTELGSFSEYLAEAPSADASIAAAQLLDKQGSLRTSAEDAEDHYDVVAVSLAEVALAAARDAAVRPASLTVSRALRVHVRVGRLHEAAMAVARR